MKELKKQQVDKVIEYLKKDIANCLYIYVDIAKYGLDNPNMRVWIDDENEMNTVVMKYHDGFQVYSNGDGWDRDGVKALVREYSPSRIAGPVEMIRGLEKLFAGEFHADYGVIMKRDISSVSDRNERDRRCQLATEEELPEIAELLLTEKEFGQQYSKEELVLQLKERLQTKMGRSIVIRHEGAIVGHIGTFAEIDEFVIISGTVIDPVYRNTDYFQVLNENFRYLMPETTKKDAYFFITNRRLMKLYQKLFCECAEYGRLIRK